MQLVVFGQVCYQCTQTGQVTSGISSGLDEYSSCFNEEFGTYRPSLPRIRTVLYFFYFVYLTSAVYNRPYHRHPHFESHHLRQHHRHSFLRNFQRLVGKFVSTQTVFMFESVRCKLGSIQ